MRQRITLVATLVGFLVAGCERSTEKSSGSKAAPPPTTQRNDQTPQTPGGQGTVGAKGSPAQPTAAGHGGAVIELGTATVGDYAVRASRDKGDIKPGSDAPIDVWITTAAGEPAKVVAVRFWIGTETAKGSAKAKADIEDAKEPHHWHTHAEVPDPLPSGSKLWVEIEDAAGKKTAASFELKG